MNAESNEVTRIDSVDNHTKACITYIKEGMEQ